MRLGICAAGAGTPGSTIGGRFTDVEIIAGDKSLSGPFAAGLCVNDLQPDIEVVGLFHIGNGCFIINVPFLAAAIQDIEAIGPNWNDLPGPDRRAGITPSHSVSDRKRHIRARGWNRIPSRVSYVGHVDG